MNGFEQFVDCDSYIEMIAIILKCDKIENCHVSWKMLEWIKVSQ